MLSICRSSYYAAKQRRRNLDVYRMRQRAAIRELFKASRGFAGSRTLMWQMRGQGHQVGRFRVQSLMAECGLKSRQPGRRYKRTGTGCCKSP